MNYRAKEEQAEVIRAIGWLTAPAEQARESYVMRGIPCADAPAVRLPFEPDAPARRCHCLIVVDDPAGEPWTDEQRAKAAELLGVLRLRGGIVDERHADLPPDFFDKGGAT